MNSDSVISASPPYTFLKNSASRAAGSKVLIDEISIAKFPATSATSSLLIFRKEAISVSFFNVFLISNITVSPAFLPRKRFFSVSSSTIESRSETFSALMPSSAGSLASLTAMAVPLIIDCSPTISFSANSPWRLRWFSMKPSFIFWSGVII